MRRCAAALSRNDNTKSIVGIIAIVRACAETSLLTARLIAQGSEFTKEYCALNAEVCHTCRKECLKQPDFDECRRCAEAALACEQACQEIAA